MLPMAATHSTALLLDPVLDVQPTAPTDAPQRSTRRVMVVAAHRTVREAIVRALQEQGLTVSTDAAPGREALVAALGSVPHVVLVDMGADEAAGLDTCRRFRQAAVNTRLVALTPRLGNTRHAALAAGADGVVSSDVSLHELARFIDDVAARRDPRAPRRTAPTRVRGGLSAREHEVLSLAASGLTDAQIADSLCLSAKTVKNHLRSVYTKLGARTRTSAVVVAVRQGLLTL